MRRSPGLLRRTEKTRRGTTPVRLRPPETVPISEEDYEQAITALSTMILDWWQSQQKNRKPE